MRPLASPLFTIAIRRPAATIVAWKATGKATRRARSGLPVALPEASSISTR
jgi:hypothetical protein